MAKFMGFIYNYARLDICILCNGGGKYVEGRQILVYVEGENSFI